MSLFCVFSPFLPISIFSFCLLLISSWFFYLFRSCFFFNQSSCLNFFDDEISMFMVFITIFVLFVSFIYCVNLNKNSSIFITLLFMLIFCLGVFLSSNLFLIYFFYEASLLPILYIIIKWGSYPERSLSAMILLIYTSIFTFPFIIVIFYHFHLNFSFSLFPSFSSSYTTLNSLSTLVVFLTFAVNLPIYGLHFWLPMAHVEAPTFGSIILAGVLLKLGGVGLLRFSSFMDLHYISTLLLSYFIIFMIFVTFVCLFQSDFKRLVAYSSVSHMIAVPILLLANNITSVNSIVLLMFFHGLSSPVLFILVGVIYSIFSTRQLIMIRGIVLISPLLSFLIIMAFFFTLSAPPFPSFVAEVYFLVSSFYLSHYFIYVFIVFTFFSLVYNLNWLVSMVFSTSTTSNMSYTLTYISFIPLFASLIFCLLGLLLIPMLWQSL